MKSCPLEIVVATARSLSPYYRGRYAKVPERDFALADLPPVDHASYWKNASMENGDVLTGPVREGIVFKSGGTTGSPKFVAYARDEWQTMCEGLGWGLHQNGLADGDRVGNLFYAGELYSSFLFLSSALMTSPANTLHFPISGAAPLPSILQAIRDFHINVLLGVPTTILTLAEAAKEAGTSGLGIRKIFFAGETLYPDQREFLSDVFPGVEIRSAQYASVDGSLMGYADRACGFNEHRAFPGLNLIEILDDETGLPIEETEKEGTLLVTCLFRLLMPVIRYPVGDRAIWRDPPGTPNRRFVIQGRSEEGVRIGPVTLYTEDLRRMFERLHNRFPILDFQMMITRAQMRDKLTLRIASHLPPEKRKGAEAETLELLYHERHPFQEAHEKGLIHPLGFEWGLPGDLTTNPRTGKIRRVLDLRFETKER